MSEETQYNLQMQPKGIKHILEQELESRITRLYQGAEEVGLDRQFIHFLVHHARMALSNCNTLDELDNWTHEISNLSLEEWVASL